MQRTNITVLYGTWSILTLPKPLTPINFEDWPYKVNWNITQHCTNLRFLASINHNLNICFSASHFIPQTVSICCVMKHFAMQKHWYCVFVHGTFLSEWFCSSARFARMSLWRSTSANKPEIAVTTRRKVGQRVTMWQSISTVWRATTPHMKPTSSLGWDHNQTLHSPQEYAEHYSVGGQRPQ